MSTIIRHGRVMNWNRETSHPDPWTLSLGALNGTIRGDTLVIHGSCLSDPDLRNVPIGAQVKITIEIQEPKTKVVPWKAEEVPLGAWLRVKGYPGAVQFTRVSDESVTVVNGNGSYDHPLSFKRLAEVYEHSTDGGKTWRPAGKETMTYE